MRRGDADGKTKNGFLHVTDLAAEESEGWISCGYVVYDEPEPVNAAGTVTGDGRVACRKWIGGKITGWVMPGDTVTVYYRSEEWCCTNNGYIRTAFLEVAKG